MTLSETIIHPPLTITGTTTNTTASPIMTTGITTTTRAALYGSDRLFIRHLVLVPPGGTTIFQFPFHPTVLHATTTAPPITTAGPTAEADTHPFTTEGGVQAGTEDSPTSAIPGQSTAPTTSTNRNQLS